MGEITILQNAREILRMDADWLFYKGDPQDAYERNFDDKDWTSIHIPHDWSIEGPFDQSNPSGPDGGFLPGGIGWYRKHFNLTEIDSGKKVYIYFDGIYRNSEVWCNGHFIGKRPSGYMGFYYDLTPYVTCGELNTLAIRVDNSDQPNSRWYTGSGIYRSVWLTICSPLHINYWGTYITTPQISDTESTVQIETTVTNDYQLTKNFSLETFIYDQADQLVAKQSKQISAKAGKESKIKQIFTLENPNLWSIESPNMYRALSRIVLHNTTIDDYMTPFGIREITFTSNEGMKLNGKTVKLKGVNLHHDAGSVGAAVPSRMLESRLQTLQELGCNAIRCSHNPPAQDFLDLCDQMGFLVIAESFDKWWCEEYGYGESFKTWWQIDLQAMLLRDRNHPSIIMWSVGNEVEGQWSKRATDTLTLLA